MRVTEGVGGGCKLLMKEGVVVSEVLIDNIMKCSTAGVHANVGFALSKKR